MHLRRPLAIAFALLLIIPMVTGACASAPSSEPRTAPEAVTAPNEETSGELLGEDEATAANSRSSAPNMAGATLETTLIVGEHRGNLGGVYTKLITTDGATLHPYQAVDSVSFEYIAMLYDCCLLRRNPDTLELEPYMAERVAIAEDGKTFTFQLRDDIEWSDGTPLTAYDYQWTWEQVTDPANEYPYLGDLEFITRYEAIDDYTLQATVDRVYAPALEKIASAIRPLPKHIWEGKDWNDPGQNSSISAPTVVSGPYKLVSWKRDQEFVAEVNENYWNRGAPSITNYRIEIVPDEDVAFQRFVNGDADSTFISPNLLDEARALENAVLYEWWPVQSTFFYVGLNMREGSPTSDVHLRRGINYAVDKDLLVEEALSGTGGRLCSTFPPTSWVHEPAAECYAYDPEKARAEFEAAGYTFDGEKLVDASGKQLTLRFAYGPNTDETTELIAVIIQDYLGRAGIAVELQPYDWATYMDVLAAPEPDWDMHFVGWGTDFEPDDMKFIWQSAYIPDLNSHAYDNPQVDQMWEDAAATFDADKRKATYQEIQRILAQDAPMIFLYYGKDWSGQSMRVHGIDPKPIGITWNQNDWYLDPQ